LLLCVKRSIRWTSDTPTAPADHSRQAAPKHRDVIQPLGSERSAQEQKKQKARRSSADQDFVGFVVRFLHEGSILLLSFVNQPVHRLREKLTVHRFQRICLRQNTHRLSGDPERQRRGRKEPMTTRMFLFWTDRAEPVQTEPDRRRRPALSLSCEKISYQPCRLSYT